MTDILMDDKSARRRVLPSHIYILMGY